MAQPCNGISSSSGSERRVRLELDLAAVEVIISRITQLEARYSHNQLQPYPSQEIEAKKEEEGEDYKLNTHHNPNTVNGNATNINGDTIDNTNGGNTELVDEGRNSTTSDEPGKTMSDVAFTKERSAVGARMTVASSSSDVRAQAGHKREADHPLSVPTTTTNTTKKPKLRFGPGEDEADAESERGEDGSIHTMSILSSEEATSSQRRDEDEQQTRVWERCVAILDELKNFSPEAWVFGQPVTTLWPELTGYGDVIKRPMDLGTVRTRVDSRVYSRASEFAADVRLTFDNATRYNAKGSKYHSLAKRLLLKFNSSYKAVERIAKNKKKAANKFRPVVAPIVAPVEVVQMDSSPVTPVEVMEVHTPAPTLRPPSSQVDALVTPRHSRPRNYNRLNPRLGRQTSSNAYGGVRELTNRELTKLSELVELFPPDRRTKVIDILREKYPHMVGHDEVVELDLEQLDRETQFTIYRLAMNWQKSKNKVLNKRLLLEDHDLDLASLQLSSDNVDIGGESPVREQLQQPLEQQQQSERKEEETTSSSSSGGSSSDSDSSSSGTDDSSGDSSSDKESEGEDAAESDKG